MYREAPEPRESTSLLIGIIAICVAVELALLCSDIGLLDQPRLRSLAIEYGAFWPGLLRDWRPNYALQPWTMFATYGFLHAGLVHLVFNMMALWSLGKVVLARIGPYGFLCMYLLSMVFGALAYAALATAGRPMVGASGALFGLAGALVAWAWTSRRTTLESLRATWKALAFLIGVNLVMYIVLQGRIAWETHLGGFVAGWISGIVLDRIVNGQGEA